MKKLLSKSCNVNNFYSQHRYKLIDIKHDLILKSSHEHSHFHAKHRLTEPIVSAMIVTTEASITVDCCKELEEVV